MFFRRPYLSSTVNQVRILQRNLFENLFNIDQFNKYLKTVERTYIYVEIIKGKLTKFIHHALNNENLKHHNYVPKSYMFCL